MVCRLVGAKPLSEPMLVLVIRTMGTNLSEISIEIVMFSFKKMRLEVSSEKRWPFCLGPNVLNAHGCQPVNRIDFVRTGSAQDGPDAAITGPTPARCWLLVACVNDNITYYLDKAYLIMVDMVKLSIF